MRLSQKLILFVLLAAIAPLSLAGFWLLRQAEFELETRLGREQQAIVAGAAEGVSAQLLGGVNAIAQSAGLIDWPSASAEEARGGLTLLLGQAALARAVIFVAGAGAHAPLLVAAQDSSPAGWGALADALPLSTLGAFGERGQTALGPPRAGLEGPWVPVAIQVGPRGPQAPMIVAALALTGFDAWLGARAPEGGVLELVDSEGRVVASSLPGQRLQPAPVGRWSVVQAGHSLAQTPEREQVAFAPLPGRVGMFAVSSVPLAVARAPVTALRRTVLAGLGATATLLVLAALVFVRGITGRLEAVAQVAQAYARGELASRAPVSGSDELAELAGTFNTMGAELETARGRLLRWNDELSVRVDAATADLRAAQGQLVEAQKLAAIGQLGAGVAHEINNPLCGILGNAQLLLMDHPTGDPDFALLQQIEESARRCRDVTQNLLRFSQMRGEVHLATLDLNHAVNAALDFEQPRNAEAAVGVIRDLAAGPLLIDGDADAIQQIVAQLFSNARTAVQGQRERKITVTTCATERGAALVVEDTGKGIAPEHLSRVFDPFFTTKDVWTNIGLGLSVAYRLVQEHGGRFEASSPPSRGARFTVQFVPPGKGPRPKPELLPGAELTLGGAGTGILG